MRPKIAMWSDYRSPAQKRWRSPYRRSTRSSTSPKILVAAVVVVAGVIGLSGIYPQIIDSEWVQETSTDSQRVAHPEPAPRRSGIAAEIPLPPRRTPVTTGAGVTPTPAPTPAVTPAPATPPAPTPTKTPVATPPASAPRALAAAPAPAEPTRAAAAVPAPAPASPPALQEMPPSVAVVQLQPNETAQPLADNQDVQAVADPPTEPAPVATVAVKPAQRYVARVPVVKKRIVRNEHHRSYSGAYAQYGGGRAGGWGGRQDGSWSGSPSFGSPYHF
jgi:hypothetical protein